jgi:hypothetical protein
MCVRVSNQAQLQSAAWRPVKIRMITKLRRRISVSPIMKGSAGAVFAIIAAYAFLIAEREAPPQGPTRAGICLFRRLP